MFNLVPDLYGWAFFVCILENECERTQFPEEGEKYFQ